jgi:V/A-type H+/Na+-transporting ATPase subunit D
MAETEAPSKTLLLEKRDEHLLVNEGRSVLEERQDILAQAIMARLRETEVEYRNLIKRLASTRQLLQSAILVHGATGLQRFETKVADGGMSPWTIQSYFGTGLIAYSNIDVQQTEEGPRFDQSIEVAWLERAFRLLLTSLAECAASLSNLHRLTREFRRTQRKVNALEHVILPELEAAISTMEFSLDEMERENLVSARMMKRRSASSGLLDE